MAHSSIACGHQNTRTVVAGPGVYICEACVALAESVIASRQEKETALGTIEPVPANALARRCSFCGKHRHQVRGLASTIDNPAGKLNTDAAICGECLALCREIHAEQSA